MIINCKQCGKKYTVIPSRLLKTKFCSRSCRSIYTGFLRSQRAKPRLSTQGYFFVKNATHHRANKQGYAKVADIVLEDKIGRKLKPNEVAHHIDINKQNDSPDNLLLVDKSEHSVLHCKKNWADGKFPIADKKYNWAGFSKEESIALFLSGVSLRAIGRKYGVKHDTVKTHLTHWGIYANN